MQTEPVSSLVAPVVSAGNGRRSGRRVAVCLVLVGGLATVAVAATRIFSSGADVQALSATCQEAAGGDWQPNIQIPTGPILLPLVRMLAAFVPDVPAEARAALRAIRSAEVSIHHLERQGRGQPRFNLLERVDARLEGRGLERVVGVVEGDQVVGVYAPAGAPTARHQHVAVMVLDGDELITLGAQVDVEQLAELAWRLRAEPRFTGGVSTAR
jgi:hypothetical protein